MVQYKFSKSPYCNHKLEVGTSTGINDYEANIRIAKPGECCTESWLVASAFPTEEEIISFKSYLFTKIVRFLLLQTVVSQHVNKENFVFIPDLDNYAETYTDDVLRQRWRITEDEWNFIDSKIK